MLVFHGWGGDENEFLDNPVVIREADRRGAILVAPRGLGSGAPDMSFNSWSFLGSTEGEDPLGRPICNTRGPDYSYPSCGTPGQPGSVAQNTCSWTHCQGDDVDFALSLIDFVDEYMCIDTENVFAAGGSNGGMYTWTLGQDARSADRFRAIAALIGLPHRGFVTAKATEDDLPALLITGEQDTTVPPGNWEDPGFTSSSGAMNESYYYTSATAITRSWARAHGCDISTPAEPFERHRSGYDCRTYCGDDPRVPRVLDCRTSGGHDYDFGSAWPLVMNFFTAHYLPN